MVEFDCDRFSEARNRARENWNVNGLFDLDLIADCDLKLGGEIEEDKAALDRVWISQPPTNRARAGALFSQLDLSLEFVLEDEAKFVRPRTLGGRPSKRMSPST